MAGALTQSAVKRLWLIRHGQSAGNVADDAAKAAGSPTVSVGMRDPDVPLTDLGRRQAAALGSLWRPRPGEQSLDVPDAVFSSPYIRAHDTARIAVETAAADVAISTDERLRERDLGLFDGLTAQGIRERYPEETARRAWLGKFYYRPPYGESWADVALRVHAFLADMRSGEGERITIFSHQAVLFVFRYVIERLTEQQILSIDRGSGFHNGGITSYATDSDGRLQLVAHDAIDHLHDQEAPATMGHDSHVEV